MSISFGSTGIKPYVGNKEVQEAYVGSTLVYQNEIIPSGNVIFDGSISSKINPIATTPATEVDSNFNKAVYASGKVPDAILNFIGESSQAYAALKVPTPNGFVKITTGITTSNLAIFVYSANGIQKTTISIRFTANSERNVNVETGGFVVLGNKSTTNSPVKKITV